MNPHRIAAIVHLTLRDAVRSRVVISLLVMLLLVLIGLPLLIQSDGTPVGRLRVMLEYALAAAVSLLSAATLWAGCASVAAELQDRRLFVVLSKPVHRAEIWLGKWLGIVILDAAALLVTGLVLAGLVAMVRPAGRDAGVEALLSARESVLPDLPEETGKTPAGKAVGEEGRHTFAAEPGGSIDLFFPVPDAQTPTGAMELRVRLGTSRPERAPIASQWVVGPANAPVASLNTTNHPGLPVTLPIPISARDAGVVRVHYVNAEVRYPATVVMDPGPGGIELLVPRGGFSLNLIRGLLIVLARLAFLAALGVTVGCLLSLPVAVFVAVFVLVLLASAGYVETVATTGVFYVPHEGGPASQGWIDRVVLHVFESLNTVTHPLIRLDPVPLLAEGRRVAWSLVGRAAWICGFAYVGLVALFGIWRFTKREAGLVGTE